MGGGCRTPGDRASQTLRRSRRAIRHPRRASPAEAQPRRCRGVYGWKRQTHPGQCGDHASASLARKSNVEADCIPYCRWRCSAQLWRISPSPDSERLAARCFNALSVRYHGTQRQLCPCRLIRWRRQGPKVPCQQEAWEASRGYLEQGTGRAWLSKSGQVQARSPSLGI